MKKKNKPMDLTDLVSKLETKQILSYQPFLMKAEKELATLMPELFASYETLFQQKDKIKNKLIPIRNLFKKSRWIAADRFLTLIKECLPETIDETLAMKIRILMSLFNAFGDAECAYTVYLAYQSGLYVPVNKKLSEEAFKWAHDNHLYIPTFCVLGDKYFYGHAPFNTDYEKAKEYYQLVIKKVETDIDSTDSYIIEAREKAYWGMGYIKLVIEQNAHEALNFLLKICLNPVHTPAQHFAGIAWKQLRKYKQAKNLLEQHINNKHIEELKGEAAFALANLHKGILAYKTDGSIDKTQSIEKNDEQYHTYLKIACDYRHVEATLIKCGYLYDNKEYKNVFDLLSKPYMQGNYKAQIILSECYFKGLGTSIDYDKGIDCLKIAIGLGDANACFVLSEIYLHGKYGMPINIPLAEKYFQEAVSPLKKSILNAPSDAKKFEYLVQIGDIYAHDLSQNYHLEIAVDYYQKAKLLQENNEEITKKLDALIQIQNENNQKKLVALSTDTNADSSNNNKQKNTHQSANNKTVTDHDKLNEISYLYYKGEIKQAATAIIKEISALDFKENTIMHANYLILLADCYHFFYQEENKSDDFNHMLQTYQLAKKILKKILRKNGRHFSNEIVNHYEFICEKLNQHVKKKEIEQPILYHRPKKRLDLKERNKQKNNHQDPRPFKSPKPAENTVKNNSKLMLWKTVPDIPMEISELDMLIPEEVKLIKNLLRHNGFAAYTKGGAPRNYLMSLYHPHLPAIKIKDWDLITNAHPTEIYRIIHEQTPFMTQIVSKKFPSVLAWVKGYVLEINTFRSGTGRLNTDGTTIANTDYGVFQSDMALCDFTINACYLDLTGKLKTHIRTKIDIQNKHLVFMMNPTERLRLDPSIGLRALKFMITLGVTIPDEATQSAIREHAFLIRNINKIKLYQKIRELLCLDGIQAIKLLAEYDYLIHLFPALTNNKMIDQLCSDENFILLMDVQDDSLSMEHSVRREAIIFSALIWLGIQQKTIDNKQENLSHEIHSAIFTLASIVFLSDECKKEMTNCLLSLELNNTEIFPTKLFAKFNLDKNNFKIKEKKQLSADSVKLENRTNIRLNYFA